MYMMYVRESQREKWRTQSQALMLALREQKQKKNTTRKSIPENEHPYQFSRNLLCSFNISTSLCVYKEQKHDLGIVGTVRDLVGK